MPLRRKGRNQAGLSPHQLPNRKLPFRSSSSRTPPHSNVTRPLVIPLPTSNPDTTNSTSIPITPSFSPSVLTTPPLTQSSRSTPRRLNQVQRTPNISLATPPSSSVMSTPVSFSSPSEFIQPQAIDSLFSEHPNAPYIRLNHITTVMTTRQYISTEIVERPTGTVVHTEFNEVNMYICTVPTVLCTYIIFTCAFETYMYCLYLLTWHLQVCVDRMP